MQQTLIAFEVSQRVDEDVAASLVRAARRCGIDHFFGVVNDDHFVKPESMAFTVALTVEDLEKFSQELVGLNAVLVHPGSPVFLLATVDDYSVLAASSSFITEYEPDPRHAIEEFRGHAMTQDPALRPVALRALDLFERYGPR